MQKHNIKLNQNQDISQLFHDEVPLFDNSITSKDKEVIETLSEIYSIIITLDHVEKAYLKDSIDDTQYTNTVDKLLKQFKVYLNSQNKEEINKHFQSIEARTCDIHYHIGSLGDNKQSSSSDKKFNAKYVAEATGNFITVMDALKLNYNAKDQLHPLLAELLISINRVTRDDFENRSKLIDWIVRINKLSIGDTLTETQIRELLFDLELAYKSFYALLD
ncbi:Vacuolar protein-sorting-associated protein 28 [Saccharomyces pastorianus]|uniref:Vacuolar protein sorting-associated protein 28 n=1 Tax=Saccharomyces pastorianus TaxID=27292 RepID=A0A6C1E1L6_SACPS|nr:Vacuolar protein-sorting-associated protein 28 [Saccharomyces pastorianus]